MNPPSLLSVRQKTSWLHNVLLPILLCFPFWSLLKCRAAAPRFPLLNYFLSLSELCLFDEIFSDPLSVTTWVSLSITVHNTDCELFWASTHYNVFLPHCYPASNLLSPERGNKTVCDSACLAKPQDGEISAEPYETAHCLYLPNKPWHAIPFTLPPQGSVGPINKQPIYLRGQFKHQTKQQLWPVSQKTGRIYLNSPFSSLFCFLSFCPWGQYTVE